VAGGGGDTASFRQTRSLLLRGAARGALSFISAKCRRLIYVLLFASLKCLNSEQKRIEMAPFYDFASGYDKQTQPKKKETVHLSFPPEGGRAAEAF
jgi:hypothetical protein